MVRMRCPKVLEIAWKDSPPFFYVTPFGNGSGAFPQFIRDLVWECCNNLTSLYFISPKEDLRELSEVVKNETADIVFPMLGKQGTDLLFGNPYFSFAESPGMIYFSATKPSASEAIYTSISDAWPVLIFVLLYSMVVGALFWFVELFWITKREQENSLDFQFTSFRKILEGFWWAVVSMTTVGYGDYSPRTVSGRIVAVVWILIGLVTVSTFTATITSVLTAACLANEFSLSGLKVTVLMEGAASRYATQQNADINEVRSVSDLAQTLQNRVVNGALIDTYIAGHFQEQLENFRLTEVIEYPISYGFVTSRRGKWIRPCVMRYMESNRNDIFKTLMETVKALKPTTNINAATEKSSNLFDPRSFEFQVTLVVLTGTLVILVILGTALDRIWRRKWQKEKKNGLLIFPSDDLTETELHRRHQAESHSLLRELRQNIEDIEDSLTRKIGGLI